jgi:hypothetical protein
LRSAGHGKRGVCDWHHGVLGTGYKESTSCV